MATQYKIERDAENEKIVIRRVNDATGASIANYPTITISLADVYAALTGEGLSGTDLAVNIKFVWLRFKDADADCAPMKMLVLGMDPISDA